MASVMAGGGACATELGIEGAEFTVDGQPTFLVGMSYYGALGASEGFIQADLDDLQHRGFNWVRVWVTWSAHENNVSAVDARGDAREPFLSKLKWLAEQADARGITVDVTLSRGNGVVSEESALRGQPGHLRAVATLARALKPYRNVYIDVGNERNIRDPRFVSHEDIKALRDQIKQIDPDRLVTASYAGDMPREELETYLLESDVDFISPHRPRNARSPWDTAEKTRQFFAWMRDIGRTVPVHYQEPFRRDFSRWQPRAIDFLVDARQAREAGAAGWCLHNGSPRRNYQGRRRSFDMRDEQGRLFAQLDPDEGHVADHVARLADAETKTWIALMDTRWHVDGRITYPGAAAEGLLMNVRMVNCVFEDRNEKTMPARFDPAANTDAFIAQIPDYVAHGMRAFTVFLQGGMPGYENAINSAFTPEGELRTSYMERVRRVIEAADAAGAAVILGCYYQRQDQILRDADAVRTGVVNVVQWIMDNRLGNVLLEIANEYPHRGFDHHILRTPSGIAELVRLAKETAPGILVSASGLGNGKCDRDVAEAADFILIHFNGTPVDQIPSRVEALRGYEKAIVCNEDQKVDEEAARACDASVANGCSWGLMLEKLNQNVPFEFKGHEDDVVVYGKLKELTTPAQ
ncbi:MAG: hypothetical protein PVH68_05280 [Armatimonadota bacterium]|jgi:hypothetical protein